MDRPPLVADALAAAAAAATPPGDATWRVELYEEVTSTNAVAAAVARTGAAAGLVVVAEHQSAGRGRLDRTWTSPPRAGVTLSMLLRPPVPLRSWSWLPLLLGVAVTDAVAAGQPAVPARLKWPNDVLVGDAKLAGLLAERVADPTGSVAVLGAGINVTTTRAELPGPGATSLLVAGGGTDRTALVGALLDAVGRRYGQWLAAPAGLADVYRDRCATLGRQVRVASRAGGAPGAGDLHGVAVDVDADGCLVVETAAGTLAVSAGDVVHLR